MITRLFALLALTALTASAQVMLPHRHFELQAQSALATGCGTPPFTSNLVQWLCAWTFINAGLPSGTLLTNWPDSSPAAVNGLYYTNNTGSQLAPSIVTGGHNGQPFVSFGQTPGTSSPMVNSNAWWTGATEAQIFYVVEYLTNVTTQGLETLGTGSNERIWDDPSVPAPQLSFGSSAIHTLSTNGDLRLAPFYVLSMWSKASDWGVLSNNVQIYSTAVNTVAFPASADASYIGYSKPAGYNFFGNIYEILVFTNKLTGAQNTNVWTWLQSKYAL